MKTKNTESTLIVQLSLQELWFLAHFFAPGAIFGVENPTNGLSEDQAQALEQKTLQQLEKSGVLVKDNANQYQIDEMIGGMVYSCIHSDVMMAITDQISGKQQFFHFLPQWQLSLTKEDNSYELCIYRNRADIFTSLFPNLPAQVDNPYGEQKFTIPERELELAVSLMDSEKHSQAIQVMKDNLQESALNAAAFLKACIDPDQHLFFDLYYSRNDPQKLHQRRNGLLQLDQTLFWFVRDYTGEEELPILTFVAIDATEAANRFNIMLKFD